MIKPTLLLNTVIHAATVVTLAAVISACGDSANSSTDPTTGPTISAADVAAGTTLDIAAIAADAAAEDVAVFKVNLGAFGIVKDTDSDRFERWSACPYDAAESVFFCAAQVRGSFTTTRSYAYFTDNADEDGSASLQPAYDARTTAAAYFVWSLKGSITRDRWSGYVTRDRFLYVSDLLGSNGTITIFGNGGSSSSVAEKLRANFLGDSAGPNSLTRTYILESTSEIRATTPGIRLPDAWPTSGAITRDFALSRIDAAGTTFATRRAIVTFNGTQFVDLIVRQYADNGTAFVLDLATGKVTRKAA